MSAFWDPYVSVGQRKAKAGREITKLRKSGKAIYPVEIEGRLIARSFWGKRWCEHLESFSDFSNRLPRGRTYARNGSVCHLEMGEGLVEALVSGSAMYTVRITIAPLDQEKWSALKAQCVGRIASMLELLKGQLSDQVMGLVVDRTSGLFPLPREIKLGCSCPDGARMCKHLAAVLYGVGHRLDTRPDLLFVLRGVDPLELFSSQLALPTGATDDTLDESRLGDIFGIDLDEDFAG